MDGSGASAGEGSAEGGAQSGSVESLLSGTAGSDALGSGSVGSGPAGQGPTSDRPLMFGGHPEPALLPWGWATARLTDSRHYWIATTRPDGRPHARPVWGVWSGGAVWFSTGSAAVANLAVSPEVSVNLESGGEVVILEGVAGAVSDVDRLAPVVAAYEAKYRWEIDPASPPGPFFAVTPRVAFGWVSDPSGLDAGAAFGGTATRWRFARAG